MKKNYDDFQQTAPDTPDEKAVSLSKKRANKYRVNVLILLLMSVIIMAIVFFSDRGDITSATLILTGFGCFIAAILLLTFYSGEGLNPVVANLMPVGFMISLSRIFADLGVQGNAHFIPAKDKSPAEVMQFNPVSSFHSIEIPDNFSFYTGSDGPGILSVPSGSHLLSMLLNKNSLLIPDEEDDLFQLIKEVGEDNLEIADSVSVTRSGENLVIEMRNYLLFQGCIAVREESPKCCTMNPCPVCSLMACIVAGAFQKTTTIEAINVDAKKKSITLILSVLS